MVAGAGRWLFQASESAVFGTALGRKEVEPQALPPSGGQGIALPQVSSPRAWCSTGAAVSRKRVAQFDCRLTDQPRVCDQPVMAAPSVVRTPLGRLLFQSLRASNGCLRFIIQ